MGPDNVYPHWDILKTHFIVRIGLFYDTAYFLSHAHIFNFPEFHSGLIWNQTIFANVNRERKREWETGTCTSFRENQSISTDRQVEREMCVCVCVCVCVFFLNFVIFLTLRTRLRISKFRVYLCKKNWSTRCPWVTVYHYKRHLRRWRSNESVLVFWRENESVAIHR